MGGGTSTFQRARKAVVIRAYNSRSPDQTLSEQFETMCQRNSSGQKVLLASDVKIALGLSQLPWFDDLLIRLAGNEIGELDFESFIAFLENGTEPAIVSVAEPKKPAAPAPSTASEMKGDFGKKAQPPPGPPLMGFSAIQPSGAASEAPYHRVLGSSEKAAFARRSVKDAGASPSDATYPDAMKVLKFKEPTDSRELTRHGGSTVSLTFADSYKKAGPSRPLWRKRETVVQERIVQYTTVDAEGIVQELVESERSQNEIVHLECKETGEFAHRECQEYEQLETFNNEVVAAERGNEEYLHMKSKDDEYEHLESNMPRVRRAEEEAAAAAAAAAEEAAAAMEAERAPQTAEGTQETRGGSEYPGDDGGMGTAEMSSEARAWWAAQRQENSGEQMENADKENCFNHPHSAPTSGNQDHYECTDTKETDCSQGQQREDGELPGSVLSSDPRSGVFTPAFSNSLKSPYADATAMAAASGEVGDYGVGTEEPEPTALRD